MRLILPCLFILLLPACGTREKQDTFKREQEQWEQERIARLKSDSGWLNLAGLYWLEEGENTFGSDSSNRIVFPAKAPARMGKYILRGDSLRFMPEDGAGIMNGGVPATEMAIRPDRTGNVMGSGSLAWFIIERGGRYAIRLRDFENPALKEFRGIESFEADRKWNVPAEFRAFPEPVEMLIATVTGSVEKNLCPGILRFEAGGKRLELHPVLAGNRLFIIFADETNGDDRFQPCLQPALCVYPLCHLSPAPAGEHPPGPHRSR
jgi:uncharacterized protein (DUF1684 family)